MMEGAMRLGQMPTNAMQWYSAADYSCNPSTGGGVEEGARSQRADVGFYSVGFYSCAPSANGLNGEMGYVELRPAPETAAGIFVEPRRIFLAFSRCPSRADKRRLL
jgi:hypothetical protein